MTEATVSDVKIKNDDAACNGLDTSDQLATETVDKVPIITDGDGLKNDLALTKGTSFLTRQAKEISSKIEDIQKTILVEDSSLTIQEEGLPSLIEEAQESIVTEDSTSVPQSEELSFRKKNAQESAITNNSSLVIESEKVSSHKEAEILSFVTNAHVLTSRPSTPLDEKIVPGSICRRDLELHKDESQEIQGTAVIQKEISNTKPKPIFKREELIYTFDYEMTHRPMTPPSEKIVPGSICRGVLREPEKEEATDCETLSKTSGEDASLK